MRANLIPAACPAEASAAPLVPRATPQFEAQLHANLIRAGLHRVCSPGACARPRVLAGACHAAQDWDAPQRLSSSRSHRMCPDSQELAM